MKIKFVLLMVVSLLTFRSMAAVDAAIVQPETAMTEEDYKNHLDMAGNAKLNMNSRWKSLLKATDYAGKDQIGDFKKFTDDKEWYMRNASLVALNKISGDAAVVQAKKLLTDKALVVRSAAVEILGKHMSAETKKLFIIEVDKEYNFNKKTSLWIRRQLLEKIARVANSDDRALFVKNLFDQDQKISQLSARTLERITGKKLPEKRFVENWRTHAKDNKWQ